MFRSVSRVMLLLLSLLVALTGCATDEGSDTEQRTQTGLARTAVPVSVAVAEQRSLAEAIRLTGTLQAFKKSTVAAEVSGQVVQRLVEPGQKVNKGDPLIEADATLLRQRQRELQANVAARDVALASAKAELKRGRDLIKKSFISQDQLEDLEFSEQRAVAERQAARAALASATESLRDVVVRAPFSGRIERVHVQQGDFINPGQPVAMLADFSKMRVIAGVTAQQAQRVGEGDLAHLIVQGGGGQALDGTVQSIGRIADPTTGSYPLEIWLEGEQLSTLRDGMVANISVADNATANVLAIPSVALFQRASDYYVYRLIDTAEGGPRAQMQRLEPGLRVGNYTQVLAGLQVGDKVVVDGQFALQDGASVIVVEN